MAPSIGSRVSSGKSTNREKGLRLLRGIMHKRQEEKNLNCVTTNTKRKKKFCRHLDRVLVREQ